MKRTHKIAAGIIVTLALGIASAAYAHSGGGFGPGSGPCAGDGSGMRHGPRSGPSGGHDSVAFAESRLGEMKSALKITAEQDSAWQAFSAKAKQQAEAMQAARGKMLQAPATAPERMAQHTEMMRARLAGMDTMAVALKDLYAQLTPEQKAIADQHFGGVGGFGGHRMGHGMRHR